MKKFLTGIMLTLVMVVGAFTFVACGAKLKSIKVADDSSQKTAFIVNENFDTTGLKIKAVYSNKTEKDVTDYSATAKLKDDADATAVEAGQPLTEEGTYVVTVTYKKLTTTYEISVLSIDSISATLKQGKQYFIGHKASDIVAADFNVTAALSDQSTTAITSGYTIAVKKGDAAVNATDDLEDADYTVTITYQGKTCTVTVHPIAVVLASVEVEFKNGAQVALYKHGTLSLDALKDAIVVTANYNDSTSEAISDYQAFIVKGEDKTEVTSNSAYTFNEVDGYSLVVKYNNVESEEKALVVTPLEITGVTGVKADTKVGDAVDIATLIANAQVVYNDEAKNGALTTDLYNISVKHFDEAEQPANFEELAGYTLVISLKSDASVTFVAPIIVKEAILVKNAIALAYMLEHGTATKITLGADITFNRVIEITADKILSLGTRTLKAEAQQEGRAVLHITNGATLTINANKGTYEANDYNFYVGSDQSNGHLIFEGKNVNKATFKTSAAHVVFVHNGTAEIAGDATFETSYSSANMLLNIKDGQTDSSIVVGGGKFKDFNPKSNNGGYEGASETVSFLKPGCFIEEDGGYYTVVDTVKNAKNFAEAIALVNEGKVDTITLGESFEISTAIEIRKNLTLNFGLNILTFKDNASFKVLNNAILTINADKNSAGAGGIANQGSKATIVVGNSESRAHLVINYGMFMNVTAEEVVYVMNGKAEIMDGAFSTLKFTGTGKYYTLNNLDSAASNNQIIVTGGTFQNFNPASNGADSEQGHTNYLAEGYSIYEYVQDDDIYYCVLKDKTVNTMTELMNALYNQENANIKLGKDIEGDSALTFGGVGRIMVLDFNGHTLTLTNSKPINYQASIDDGEISGVISGAAYIGVYNGAMLVVRNSVAGQGGYKTKDIEKNGVNYQCHYNFVVGLSGSQTKAGQLIIESGTFETDSAHIVFVENGSVTIKGGTFRTSNQNKSLMLNVLDGSEHGEIVVSGGTFEGFHVGVDNSNEVHLGESCSAADTDGDQKWIVSKNN